MMETREQVLTEAQLERQRVAGEAEQARTTLATEAVQKRQEVGISAGVAREETTRQATEAKETASQQASKSQREVRQQQSTVERQAEASKASARIAERIEQRKQDLPITRPQKLNTVQFISDVEKARKEAHAEGRSIRAAIGKERDKFFEDVDKAKAEAFADIDKQKSGIEAEIDKAIVAAELDIAAQKAVIDTQIEGWQAEGLEQIKQAEDDYNKAVADLQTRIDILAPYKVDDGYDLTKLLQDASKSSELVLALGGPGAVDSDLPNLLIDLGFTEDSIKEAEDRYATLRKVEPFISPDNTINVVGLVNKFGDAKATDLLTSVGVANAIEKVGFITTPPNLEELTTSLRATGEIPVNAVVKDYTLTATGYDIKYETPTTAREQFDTWKATDPSAPKDAVFEGESPEGGFQYSSPSAMTVEVETAKGKVTMPLSEWEAMSEIKQYETVLGRKPTIIEWQGYRLMEAGVDLPWYGKVVPLEADLIGAIALLIPGEQKADKYRTIKQAATDEWVQTYPQLKMLLAAAGSSTLEELGFPAAKAIYPQISIKDITGKEWAATGASIALWTLPKWLPKVTAGVKALYKIKLTTKTPIVRFQLPFKKIKVGSGTFWTEWRQRPVTVSWGAGLQRAGLSAKIESLAFKAGSAAKELKVATSEATSLRNIVSRGVLSAGKLSEGVVLEGKALLSSKIASRLKIAQAKSLSADTKFIESLSGLKVTAKQIKLLEQATGYKGLVKPISNVASATKALNVAWKTTIKAEKLYKSRSPFDVNIGKTNYFKSLKAVAKARANLGKAIDKLDDILKPRYTEPPAPTPLRTLPKLGPTAKYLSKAGAKVSKQWKGKTIGEGTVERWALAGEDMPLGQQVDFWLPKYKTTFQPTDLRLASSPIRPGETISPYKATFSKWVVRAPGVEGYTGIHAGELGGGLKPIFKATVGDRFVGGVTSPRAIETGIRLSKGGGTSTPFVKTPKAPPWIGGGGKLPGSAQLASQATLGGYPVFSAGKAFAGLSPMVVTLSRAGQALSAQQVTDISHILGVSKNQVTVLAKQGKLTRALSETVAKLIMYPDVIEVTKVVPKAKEVSDIELETLSQIALKVATEAINQNMTASENQYKTATEIEQEVRTAVQREVKSATQLQVKMITKTAIKLATGVAIEIKTTLGKILPGPSGTSQAATVGEGGRYPDGTIVWKMGELQRGGEWKIIPPPYTLKKAISSTKPPKGVTRLTGTPQETLTFIGGKLPFKNVSFDLGVVDGYIDVKNKRITFTGHGLETKVGTRIPESPTKGMSIPAVFPVRFVGQRPKTRRFVPRRHTDRRQNRLAKTIAIGR